MRFVSLITICLAVSACSSDPPAGSSGDSGTDAAADLRGLPDADAAEPSDLGALDVAPDVSGSDSGPDSEADSEVCDTLGCPCESAEECRGGYCVRLGGDAGSVCTSPCVDECDEEGWICSLLEQDREAVALCLPEALPYCVECALDTDCGSTSALCLEMIDGDFCAPPCLGDGLCPAGSVCEEVSADGELFDVCVPATGVCAACIDNDNDGYGLGPECLGSDCDDLEAAAFEGAPEFCDGIDNDCDLTVDEAFDLSTDDRNCGSCGNACDGGAALSACVSGECRIVDCDDGFTDCDGDPANGCERPDDALNACGGCAVIEGLSGESCGACDTGTFVCDGLEALTCAGDRGEAAFNACGGCSTIREVPDELCGACESGVWTCEGTDDIVCEGDGGDDAFNSCGGCVELDGEPATPCGTCGSGTWVCAGPSLTTCVGEDGEEARNECGGCETLEDEVDAPCGTCGSGAWACDTLNSLSCEGDLGGEVTNECGGCTTLVGASGDPCGTCESGTLVCDGLEGFTCAGDGGVGALNECGGCDELSAVVDASCGLCDDGTVICNGINSTICFGADGDSDGDGVCDGVDVCPGGDDAIDGDGDGVADFCDDCPSDNPDDTDEDGVCDTDDRCPGSDDRLDADGDGVPNACDACRGSDDLLDGDEDGTPDGCDCDATSCDSNAICAESGDGASCTCIDGYEGDGFTCSDVNECAGSPCDPTATCSNEDGGFSCACASGFTGDGFTCSDIDECASAPCDPLATCTNNPGSFTCECPSGWSGDGFSCTCPPERAFYETIPTAYFSGLTPSTVALSDDSVSGAVPIGFSFEFFGSTHTQVWISSNGYLMFEASSTNGCCTGQAIPSTGTPNNMVSIWWEDLDPVDGGTVRYGTSGSAPNRMFIVEYSSIQHYPSGTPITAQAVLYEGTNTIDINCQNCESDGGIHSQGVEDASGTLGVQRYLGSGGIGAGSWRFQTCSP